MKKLPNDVHEVLKRGEEVSKRGVRFEIVFTTGIWVTHEDFDCPFMLINKVSDGFWSACSKDGCWEEFHESEIAPLIEF